MLEPSNVKFENRRRFEQQIDEELAKPWVSDNDTKEVFFDTICEENSVLLNLIEEYKKLGWKVEWTQTNEICRLEFSL